MFRHRILVQNTSKKPAEAICYHITKIKATKTTLFENQKIFKNPPKSRFWPKFKNKIMCFNSFKNMLCSRNWVPQVF